MTKSTASGAWRRVGRLYRDALATPAAFLRGQFIGFLLISVYVKSVQVCLTPQYAVSSTAWTTGDAIISSLFAMLRFNAQEFAVFAIGLLLLQLWGRNHASSGRMSMSAWAFAAMGGLMILPILSLTEVCGLAHFAFFLTPLGPEEVRTIAWAPMLVSSSHVLEMPFVAAGVILIVVVYYLVPVTLLIPRLRQGPQGVRGAAIAVLMSLVVAVLPQPNVPQARLAPHPLLWMAVGARPQRAWASLSPDETVAAALAGHNRPAGRPRYRASQKPKNVLVLMLESTRAQSTAIYNPAARAGRDLLKYADEMVVFDHLYAAVPTSAHALFSVLYGVYPYMGAFWSTSGKSVVADSMAQLFARAGFATSFFVTADLNFDNVRSYTAPGFEHVLDLNDWPGQEAYALLPWGRDDRLLIEETKAFLAGQGARPFFLLAMTSNPHHPYAAEQIFNDAPKRDDVSSYERLVDYNLRMVVELYEWMKARGIADETLLLVLGDHGEAFGEHPGNYGHAAFIHEENLHIPAFILHPHRLGLPTHIPQLGSQVDLRATITDILGIEDEAASDGMSLLREDPERLIAHFTEGGVSHFGVRDAQFSYIYTPDSDTEQLFRWQRDPTTQRNLAGDDKELTAQYRARLRRWEAQHQLSLAKVLN